MAKTSLQKTVTRLKALAHPARLRIAVMLHSGELCVCQLTAALDLAPSTVSAHLAELRRAGCVTERKEARWVFYSLTADGAAMLATVLPEIEDDPQLLADARVVTRLRALGPEVICRVGVDARTVISACSRESRD